MSDSEYDSEDDEDYVPDEPSSEEDLEDLDEETVPKSGKKVKREISGRKRMGGIQLEGEIPEDEKDDSCIPPDEEERIQERDDLSSKKRVDDLWAAFKRDTASVRPQATTSLSSEKHGGMKNRNNSESGTEVASTSSAKLKETKKVKESPKKVEVAEIFDFAGEEVKIVKSVDVSTVNTPLVSDESKITKSKTAFLGKRPGSGLGSVLGKIGKKPKLSTLEKSKLDWNLFKKEEGIEEDLRTKNRDGYLEKQAFLNRVDHKQFEIERDIRQGVKKR